MRGILAALAVSSLLLFAAVAQSQQTREEAAHTVEGSSNRGPSQFDETSGDLADRPANIVRQNPIASLTIFVLAVFVGFEVITKVPPTLHTPLMSGSNAISGITLVGAVSVAVGMNAASALGLLAVLLATINVVGGFLVTHRMLAMFRRDGGSR